MRRPWAAWFVGMTLMGVTAVPAGAEDVPLPRPTPFARSDQSAAPAQRPTTLTAANQAAPARSATSGEEESRPLAVTGVVPVPPPSKLPPVAVGPGGTMAFDAKQRALVERVNTYLSGVQTLVGDFVQVAPDGSRSEGKFYMQKPGRIRFEYNPPSPIELVSDGQSLVVRDRKLATQDLYPLSQTPLRFLLADRIDLLNDTNLVGVYADALFVTLVIEQKQVFGGTHRLLLMFGAQDFQLRQWTITDPQGYDTTVAVYNLDSSKKLDPDLFRINYERMLQ
ncbi:MAG TPA: outer membrane lipoprotein carrier protein LolA [Xanthobacteraceae bacterium]|nr:outer membrane lipoprotein carrier protein LolA [Xanthobacteraceae bacterium]